MQGRHRTDYQRTLYRVERANVTTNAREVKDFLRPGDQLSFVRGHREQCYLSFANRLAGPTQFDRSIRN